MKVPEKALVWSAALLAATLVYTGTSRYGPAMSADSAVYLAVARSLRAGEGAVSWDGRPFVTGPPLYPLTLSALPGLGSDTLSSVRLFNAAAIGLFVLLSGLFLRRSLRGVGGVGLLTIGVLTLALSGPIHLIFLYAWSETLFLPLCAGFLLALERMTPDSSKPPTGRAGPSSPVPAALLASLACLTRYTGVALVVAGALVILAAGLRRAATSAPAAGSEPYLPAGRRSGLTGSTVGRSLLFCALSIAPLALWLGRNRLIAGTLTGERGASVSTLWDAFRSCLRTIAVWLGTDKLGPSAAGPGVLAVLVLAALALLLPARPRRMPASPAPRRSSWGVSCPPAAVFSIVYVGLLLIASLTTGFDPIDARLLSPVFLPLLALVLRGAGRLSQRAGRSGARVAGLSLAVIWLGWSGFHLATLQAAVIARGAGGFSTEAWRTSPLVAYLRAPARDDSGPAETANPHPLAGRDDLPLMSNEPAAVYLMFGREAEPAPRRTLYNSTVAPAGEIERLERMIDASGAVEIVWFGALDTSNVMTVAEVRDRLRAEPAGRYDLTPVFESVDGGVYLAARRVPSPGD